MSNNNVSVVVCVRNSEGTIGRCLDSILSENPGELIVVDGNSLDNSKEVALKKGAIVIQDGGKGIAQARHLGVMKSTKKYILFVGPDNILPYNFIKSLGEEMEKWGFQAAAPQTRVLEPRTYWDRGLDFRLMSIVNTPGPRNVIGTPTLYDGNVFDKVKYNEKAGACDDTDMGMQLLKNGFKLGIVPVIVYDVNGLSWENIWDKFYLYGTGDADFYRLHRQNWSLMRKLKSISHPFRQTIYLSIYALFKLKPLVIPWLVFAMFTRYYSWIKTSNIRKD